MAEIKTTTDTRQTLPKKTGLMTLVKGVAVLSVVVAVEIVAASILIPNAEETAAIGEKLAQADVDQQEAQVDSDTPAEASQTDPSLDTLEVNLGSYHVLTYEPNSGSSLNIDFELYGTVLAEEESEFYQLFAVNQHRIEEQVVITMRGMELTDLTAAELGLIKRKILEKTNRALGKPLLREVLFPKFSFLER
jgi:flagellar FliL protein